MKREKKQRTNVFRNVLDAMKILNHKYPAMKWEMLANVLVSVGKPLLVMAVPSLAIASIMKGNYSNYIVQMICLFVTICLLECLEGVMENHIFYAKIHTRMQILIPNLLRKVLTIRYDKVEARKYQKNMQEAMQSLEGNNRGAEYLMHKAPEFVVKIVGLFVYGAAIFVLDVRIICVMIIMCIVDIALRNYAIRYSDRQWKDNAEIYRQMNYVEKGALDSKAGKDVRVYQMQAWFHELYDGLIARQKKNAQRVQLRWYFPTIADQICIVIRDLLAYSILISQTISGEISPAVFTLYIGIIADFSEWFYGLSENVSALHRGSKEHDYYRAFMESVEDKSGDKELLTERGNSFEISFEHVSFRYEDAEKDTIHDLNLKLRAGEKVAIVGNNGAGKTTLVKLLCGLYRPTEGRILVDGVDMETLDLEEYQKRISVLFQDVEPFPFTILSNICTADEKTYSPERLQKCLESAGLEGVIEKLPQREHTYVSQKFDEKGIMMSGGEMQKLLFARAMYKDGDLMLLDEPTSALDPIAESKIYEQYNEIAKGKTAIFISHRLASTKFCERILFMEQGEVLEQGTHKELMEQKGKYREIFDVQSHYYRDIKEED